MLRYQPPAWSPLSLRAIAAGLSAGRDAPARLESLLRNEYAPAEVVLTGSGTIALTAAILGSGASGVRVALPAFGCFDLATAADGSDASVHLYDVDPVTLGPDTASLESVLAAGVDAVVFCHFYGVPVDLERWRPRLAELGVLAIDDAAQGVGASLRGTPVGLLGDVGVLSFGRGKGRSGGHGGALLGVTPEGRELAGRARKRIGAGPEPSRLGQVAKLIAQWALGRPALYGLPASIPSLRLGETVYHEPAPLEGFADVAAEVLLAAWALVGEENGARRLRGDRWASDLGPVGGVMSPRLAEGARPGWLRYPILASDGLAPRLRTPLARGFGIMPGYPTPLDSLSGFESRIRSNPVVRYPGAARLADRLFTLPTHRFVAERDRTAILELLTQR